MKERIATILSIAMLVGCYTQENNVKVSTNTGSPTTKTAIVSMIGVRDPNLFKKTVILSDTGQYSISTYFDKYISSFPFDSKDYADLKKKAIQDTLTRDTLRMDNYQLRSNSGIYILAYHLEHGSCLIYNRKSGTVIPTIELIYYSFFAGGFGDTEGRRFYVNGILFLETVDRIS